MILFKGMSQHLNKTPISLTMAQKYQAARSVLLKSKPKYKQNEINNNPQSRFNDDFWREVAAFAEEPKNLSVLEDCFVQTQPAINNELKSPALQPK